MIKMTSLSEAFPNFNKNNSPFKIFEILGCAKCGDKASISTTDDGNRNQKCSTCGTVLRQNGIKKV